MNQYAYAVQRIQDATAQTKTLKAEISEAGYSYQAAAARGDTRAATKANERYQNLRTQLAQLEEDTPNSRTLMEDWSLKDVRDIIRRAEANPDIVQIRKAMEKVGNDITTLLVKNGRISAEEGAKRMGTRPWYLKVAERSHPEVDNKIARGALLLKDRLLKPNNAEGSYLSDRPLGRSEGDVVVNRPKDALVALQEGLMEAVRDVTANNARREIVETLEKLPGARGKMFRPFEFDFGGNKTEWVNDGQYNAEGRKQLGGDRSKYVSYYKDGKRRFIEFSDDSMAKALQFAPLASVPIANATRKVWQTFTTGLAAPWFAAKSAMWDVPLAKTTSRQGRSLGLIDTYARRVFNESHAVNAILDQVIDPTAWISATSAIPYQMAMRSARAVGAKIAQDLEVGSGLFNMMAQVPGGKQYLQFVGTSMSKAFDRSVFNVYSKNLSTNLSHLTDAATIADDYAIRGKGTSLGRGFMSVVNAYKAAVESVQNSTRMAFFVENYGRLEAKHGGKIPKRELEKLVQETRNLTGDMSRTSNSKFIQGLTTVIPYSNPVIQGTRHMLGSAIPPSVAKGINAMTGGKANMTTNRTNKFWGQFITGVMLPSMGAMAVIDSWKGAQDWWYNKVPEWERGTVIPFPTYEALEYRFENGEWPEFDPKYVHKLPIAPEFMMFREPALAGLRALGMFGPATTHIKQDFGTQMASTFEQATNFATPPVAQALAAFSGGKLDMRSFLLSPFGMGGDAFQEQQNSTFGGVNADKMTTNSGIDKNVYNAIGAIFSSSGQLLAQTFNVADIALRQGDDFGEALGKATETFGYEVSRKFPNVPGLPGMERNYAFTPESEYVYDTERILDPLIGNGRQRTIELDSKDRIPRLKQMGLVPPELIKEPLLKQMQEEIYAELRKKGPFKGADEQYTELRVDLNGLEASRSKWPEEAYHEKYNEIVGNQQKLKSIQAHLLTNLEQEMVGKYGQVFKSVTGEPLTFKSLVKAIKADVGE
uniref:Large polyvalent protein associated domain-containing protein n=1 Tax=viral metagenome TaxID=1070528 RepID=A0A6M3JEG0_9ZZZZ